jgi:hypothetical protein
MDLKTAFIKYSRGLLSSAQMPIVATQALVDGYDSHSLVLLASVYDPDTEDIAALVKATMHELNIQICDDGNQLDKKFSGPLSTESQEFIEPVLNALEKNNELIILQRFAYTAGAGAGWHFIKQVSEWQKLLTSGKNKTSYTVILDKELPLRGTVNHELNRKAIELFDQLGDLMIGVFTEGDSYFPLFSFNWEPRALKPKDAEKDLARTKGKIDQFFEKHRGRKIAIGRSIWVWEEDIAEVTGYIPDDDGIARPGAY